MERTVPHHPKLVSTLEGLAELYTRTGRPRQARDLLARARKIRESL